MYKGNLCVSELYSSIWRESIRRDIELTKPSVLAKSGNIHIPVFVIRVFMNCNKNVVYNLSKITYIKGEIYP